MVNTPRISMDTTKTSAQPPEGSQDFQRQVTQEPSLGFMLGLSGGHAVKHFYQQALLLLLPAIKTSLGLTDVQIGIIGSARTIFSAGINIPAGIVADMWRSQVALILAASLSSLAIGYLIIGVSPGYGVLLVGVAATGIGTSFWHAPAFGTLAAVYPSRRATALAVHRMGGSIGDSVSPIVVGVLLGGFTLWGLEWGGLEWQSLALLLVIPALLSAASIFLAYRGTTGGDSEGASFRTYLEAVKPLLTNSAVLSMTVLATVRAMAHNALNIFIVIYMAEDLAFSDFKIGYHVALLTLFGIGFAPVMGWTADRIGRRPVIFVGLSAIAVLVFSLLVFGDGFSFTVILALLGLFLYSVNPIMLATALDATQKGMEGSATALVFTGGAIFGSLSPIIAGWLRQNYGTDGVFYFSAIIVTTTAVASLFVPMRRAT